jgi:hypothetical protein
MLGLLINKIIGNPPAASMKQILCPKWLRKKIGSTVLVFIFFCFTSGCSHSPSKPSTQDPYADISSPRESQTSDPYSGDTPWWKKPEYEWLIGTLIFIGIGVAIGGAFMISSGSGGLRIGVQN